MTRKLQAVAQLALDRSFAQEAEHRFTVLYETHFDFVWRSARMLGASADAADDVVQDVFLVAHRRLSDFEARASEKTWLFAIARRVVSAQRRSLRRRWRLMMKARSDEPESSSTPYEAAARSEAHRTVVAALAELPEEQRVVFALAELEDMTATEIAAALDVNVNTVYSRLRIARRALAARLRDQGTEIAP